MQASPADTEGFTIIEVVCVLIVLSILAAVAIPRLLTISDDARLAVVDKVMSTMQASHRQITNYWMLSGKPGAGSTTQTNLVFDNITVRFRNGQPNTTSNSNHIPVGTPDRSTAQARLFFLFLNPAPTPVIASADEGPGWVMLGTNNACASTAQVGANPRRCWEYRVGGTRLARISYSSSTGNFFRD